MTPSKRIGRNDPCWCGSSKKFKKCHGVTDEPFSLQESGEQVQRPFSKKLCLHPLAGPGVCRGQVVRAHTIQRGGGLTRIAESGHVLTLRPKSPFAILAARGELRARRIGVRDASTFSGFCEKHDAEVFAPLERAPFVGSHEQVFLLFYRAICHEAYQKRAHMEAMAILEDQMRRQRRGDARRYVAEGLSGAAAGDRDMATIKARLDRILLDRTFEQGVDFACFTLSAVPEVLCSGAMAPETDLEGHSLQDLSDIDATMSVVSYSLIPTDSGGSAVFAWLRGDGPPKALAESFARVPSGLLPSALVCFAFEYFENTYMSPVWWSGLPQASKDGLTHQTTNGAHPLQEHRPDLIVPSVPLPVGWHSLGLSWG